MKRFAILLAVIAAIYLATGFYIIKGNEQGVIRRFGRVVSGPEGEVAFVGSGLHYDLPRPFATIDRVNLNQVRTLSIGADDVVDVDGSNFLQQIGPSRQAQFLTGDKNILHLKVDVHYRISERGVVEFLYGSESPERRLQLVAETAISNAVARSGVDFVHTLGRSELQALITKRTRELAEQHDLGIDVDSVTLDTVYPPLRVKAEFLGVSNARADKERYVNEARAYAEQREAASQAEAQQRIDEAEIFHQQVVEAARSTADTFLQFVDRFRQDEELGIQSYAAARHMAMQRLYWETMEKILKEVSGKVFLESGKPVDLTIIRDPNG